MIKRKRGEMPRPGGFGLALVIGIIALVVLSLIGAVVVLTSKTPATPVALVRTATPTLVPFPTATPVWIRTATPVPTSTPVRLLSAGGSLVYSTIRHEIGSFDGDGMRLLTPTGDDVAVSPDGQKLAYVRGGQLFIYQSGKETLIETPGPVRPPAWNADSTALVFAVYQDLQEMVYRVRLASPAATPLLAVPRLVAAPLPVPGVHRFVIAVAAGAHQTSLYTVDELCDTVVACQKSTESIESVPFSISWMAYHPSGMYIFFIDSVTGGIYALETATKEITPIVEDHLTARRIAVGRDPDKLAYTDANNNLFLLDITSGVSQRLMPTAVASISWAGG